MAFGSLDGVEYDPMTGLPIGAPVAVPDEAVQQPGKLSRIWDRLTGGHGQERYQTFPETMVRGMISLPQRSIEAAAIPAGLRREDVTDIPAPSAPTADSTAFGNLMGIAPVAASPQDPLIDAGAEGAMMTMGGTAFAKPSAAAGEAVLGAGPARRAVRNDLPMDQEVRLARAETQGYDPNTVLYHGTSKDADFTKFKDSRHGTWTTRDPSEASMYAKDNDSKGLRYESGGYVPVNGADRVLPLVGKPLENPYTGQWPEKVTRAQNYKKAQSEWFDELRRAGHDGIEMGNGIRVDFDNSNLRSQFAPFDPANEGKSMILGAGAADRRAAAAPALAFTEKRPILEMEGAQNVGQGIAARSDVAGGAGGGIDGLAEAQAAAARRAAGAEALPGLPTQVMKIGDEHFVPGPIGAVRKVAEEYMAGRDPSQHSMSFPDKYHPIDPERSKAIAKAFEEMPHAPDDPKVKASYDAMANETLAQYRMLRDKGLKVTPIEPGMADPYALNPRLLAKDVSDNNHMHFFPTDQGFGTNTVANGIDLNSHPLMKPSGETLNGKPLLNNDLFRIVHDYFGHLKEGYGFRGAGEDNAYRSHAAMYSDLARPAMTTETRGQNSWVNYGPHGDKNRTAQSADTVYADQKVGLLPDWVMGDTYPGMPEAPTAPMINKTKLIDDQGLPIAGASYQKAAREALDEIKAGPKGDGPMDLSTQAGIPQVEQTPLERYVPPRGISPRMQDAMQNPAVREGLEGSMEAGRGVENWYHTEPIRQEFIKTLGESQGDHAFKQYMDLVAATSPRSDVPTNIRNASYYYAGGDPTTPNPYPYGHIAQNLHKQNVQTVGREGGWDVMQNPKPASFAENLRGNLEPVTVDTHAFRNIGMRTGDPRFLETQVQAPYKGGADPRADTMASKYGEIKKSAKGDVVVYRPQQLVKDGKLTIEEAQKMPSFWAAKPKDNEYAAAENLFREAGNKVGMRPADAQAAAWSGAGEMTGLGTVGTHTFPELMNERVLFTAKMRGEDPKKVLRDFISGKKPLLSLGGAAAVGAGSFGSLDGRE